jgi:hypothetical protein
MASTFEISLTPIVLNISVNDAIAVTLAMSGIATYEGGKLSYKNETPSGLINGINATYTSANAFDGSTLEVFRNGIKQKVIEDFNITNSTTFVFLSAPLAGDILLINYSEL